MISDAATGSPPAPPANSTNVPVVEAPKAETQAPEGKKAKDAKDAKHSRNGKAKPEDGGGERAKREKSKSSKDKSAKAKPGHKGHVSAVKVAAEGSDARCVVTIKEKKGKLRDLELSLAGPGGQALLTAVLAAQAAGSKVYFEMQEDTAGRPRLTAITLD